MLFGSIDRSMDKYSDIEKAYRENLDSWLSNLYFSIRQKDSLGNPYTVQLILDNDFDENRNESPEKKPLISIQPVPGSPKYGIREMNLIIYLY